MRYGMYQFKEQDAYDFANHVGARTQKKGDELQFRICPYCKGGRGGKDKGTFSINMKSGQFKCLRASCGISGNMVTLSKDFDFSLGNEVDEYYRPKKQYRQLKTPEKPIIPQPEAIRYLTGRGISEDVIRKFQITTRTDNDRVLVFPFYNDDSKLTFIKYRKTDFDKAKDKNKEWSEANTRPILFGMMQATDFDKPLVLTEGQIDSLSVATAGVPNAVSVPTGAKGFTWVPYCFQWIHKFSEIVIFGDFEKGQISLLDEMARRFRRLVKHVRQEDYRDCKDANELLQKYGADAVRKAVERAIPLPIQRVKDLADVGTVNIYDWKKMPTGFRQLDKLLYGGLPFGGVTLISGVRGEGKSCLASQFIAQARESKLKCFIYSGELTVELFKAWLNFQVAGGNHVSARENKWGDNEYLISQTNVNLMSEWYRDYIKIYDSNDIEGDEEEEEGITRLLERTVQQYGTEVVLIDNLMTALDMEAIEESDKYERQSRFVKKLTRLALRYNILIILVAHKRKNRMTSDANNEISGSGDISNLAMITLSYEKDDELDESQRLLKVAKNRLFGKCNYKGWIMDYDERSRRIYGMGDDKDYEFGWNRQETEVDDFEDSEEFYDDNPFG